MLLKECLIRRVGNEKFINIWGGRWLPYTSFITRQKPKIGFVEVPKLSYLLITMRVVGEDNL